MPYELDEIDIAIINSLMEDGRKSFRQISREINVSTPTVQARFQKLVSMGLVISIMPLIDTSKLKIKSGLVNKIQPNKIKMNNRISVKLDCDYCGGPIRSKPKTLRFANIERFLCCDGCKEHYKEKYKGRIDSITEKYKNSKK